MTKNCLRVFSVLAALAPVVPAQAQLIGVEFDTGAFYSISTSTGARQLIEDTTLNQIGALEYNPNDGFIYGFTSGPSAALYRFTFTPDLDDVTAEFIGSMGLFMSDGGLAFSPTGAAYAFNGGATLPALMSVNLETGAATELLEFTERRDISGLGWRADGMLIGLDSTENELLAIDPATLAVTIIDDTIPTIGSVGAIAHGPGGSFFVTSGPAAVNAGSNSLYSFDPTVGEPVLIANYENQVVGTGFSGLTFVPEPATLVLLSIGLALLPRRSR